MFIKFFTMSTNFNLDKLNNIGSGVDLKEVSQINKKRLLTFVNDFIITTVSFLNDFAQSCESRLHKCDLKMQKLEAELTIIETKLNSIPGLEVSEAESGVTIETVNKTNIEVSKIEQSELPQPTVKEDKSTDDVPDMVTGHETEDQPAPTPVSRNPELAKYFKMVQVGIPPQAVKLKMQSEGFDPDLLDG